MSTESLHHPKIHRRSWPSPQDYLEAVQTAQSSFADEELCDGVAETTGIGLPRCMSGYFASVFCFQCPTRKVAVRCFLHNVPDQQQRYAAISRFVLSDNLTYTVPFEYLEKGIKIGEDWYPILKMEWVDGITLGKYVTDNATNSVALDLLANYFRQLVFELGRAGIAHGDLQHDNILLSADGLRLVDYDGLFVPELSGSHASELGHCNYQHPARSDQHFAPYLDNFSAWVIHSSLKVIARAPALFREFRGGTDCMLLKQADFIDPDASENFARLLSHEDRQIRNYAQALRTMLDLPLEELPNLEVSAQQVCLKYPTPQPALAPDLPDWLHPDPVSTEAPGANSLPPGQPDAFPSSSSKPKEAFETNRSTSPNLFKFNEIMLMPGFDDYLTNDTALVANLSQLTAQLLPGEQILWQAEQTEQQFQADLRSIKNRYPIQSVLFTLFLYLVAVGPLYNFIPTTSLPVIAGVICCAALLVWLVVPLLTSLTKLWKPYEPIIRATYFTGLRFLLVISDKKDDRIDSFVASIPLNQIDCLKMTGSNKHGCSLVFLARNRFDLANGHVKLSLGIRGLSQNSVSELHMLPQLKHLSK